MCSQVDLRNDGRKRNDYRPIELETDIVTHASGSARLRLANTDVLVGVKAEIDVPYADSANSGKIEFFIDWFVIFCLSAIESILLRERFSIRELEKLSAFGSKTLVEKRI